jgi:hypothetical protein
MRSVFSHSPNSLCWFSVYPSKETDAGDYEVRAVTGEGEAYSVTGGIFPQEGFEAHYEKVHPSHVPHWGRGDVDGR